MTTATGDFAVSFTQADVNPYTHASLSYIGAERFQVVSNTFKPSVNGQGPILRYNGAMTAGATIRAKIEVGTASAAGDQIIAMIVDSSYNGYGLRINGTGCAIARWDAGSYSGLVSGTASTVASGTVLEIERIHATNTLNAYCNGVLIIGMTTVDATYTTGLAFGIAMYPDNNNLSTALSFAGDGIAVGGAVPRSLLLLGVG